MNPEFLINRSELLKEKSNALHNKSQILKEKSVALTSKSELLKKKSNLFINESELLKEDAKEIITKTKPKSYQGNLNIQSNKVVKFPFPSAPWGFGGRQPPMRGFGGNLPPSTQ